jgi:hypothetical protein
MGFLINAGVLVMSEGDIVAMRAFPIDASKSGLVEEQEHGRGGGGFAVVALYLIEALANPVIIGFFRSDCSVNRSRLAISAFYRWTFGEDGCKRGKLGEEGWEAVLDVLIKYNHVFIGVAGYEFAVNGHIRRLGMGKDGEENASTAEERLIVVFQAAGGVFDDLVDNLRLSADPFERWFDKLAVRKHRGRPGVQEGRTDGCLRFLGLLLECLLDFLLNDSF